MRRVYAAFASYEVGTGLSTLLHLRLPKCKTVRTTEKSMNTAWEIASSPDVIKHVQKTRLLKSVGRFTYRMVAKGNTDTSSFKFVPRSSNGDVQR